MSRALAALLQEAYTHERDQFARGGWPGGIGAGLPGSASPAVVAQTVPVVAPSIAHQLVRHMSHLHPLVRQHFEDGGDADGGDNDSGGYGGVGGFGGGYNSNGADNYGGSFGGFTAAERAQNAADDAASDADPSTWGGSGGGISRGGPGDPRGASTSYGGSYGGGWNSAPSSIGFSGGDTSGTTIGNASNQVASLSNGMGSATNYGGTYGSSPGYSSNGGFNPGSIGGGWSGAETPGSGIASGNGWGGGTSNSSNSGLVFGNFGGSGLGDGGFSDSSPSGGVNGGSGWGGLSDGSFSGNFMAGAGYQTPMGGTSADTGSIGGFNTPSAGAFGDLSGIGFGGFTGSDIASALSAAQGAGAFGNLSGGTFTTPGTAAAVHGGLFGSFGNQPTGSAFTGASALPGGDGPGVGGDFGYQNVVTGPAGMSVAGSPSEGLGVLGANGLGAVAGFDNFATGEGMTPSMVSSSGFTPSAANGWGLGTGFGTGTGDPVSADGERSLTVHAPQFSDFNAGYDAPSSLATPDLVRSYALTDLAKNLGADYGAKLGLPSTFGFSDPAAVSGVVGAAMNAESSMNPAAINPSSMATGLNQMLGAGTWGPNNPGPYTGSGADPAADRQSAMFGFLGRQAGVDPSSLDPRSVGVDAASAALSGLPGAFNNEEAYGLAQLATNPQYRTALAAMNNPTASIPSIEHAYTTGFEAPQTGINEQAREANALAGYNQAVGQMAALGLASPNVVAGIPGGDYSAVAQAAPASWNAAIDPSLATAIASAGYGLDPDGYSLSPMTDSIVNMNPSNLKTHIEADRRNQFAAQQAFSGKPSMVGYDAANNTTARGSSFSYNDGTAANGMPSTDDSEDGPLHTIGAYLNAAGAVIGGLPSMIFGGSDPAAAAPQTTPSYYDTTLPSALAQAGYTLGPRGYGLVAADAPANSFSYDMGYAPGTKTDALDAADLVATRGTPSFVAADLAGNALSHNVGDFTIGTGTSYDGTPSGVTYSDLWGAPATVQDTAVTSTPSYFPGDKTGLKVAAGVLGGLVGGPLGGLAAGAAAGYALDHSNPGSVDQAGGASGRDGYGGDASPTYQPTQASAGSSSGSGSASGASSSSATGSAQSIAEGAYEAALKHMPGSGPAARKSAAVPLIAPKATPATFYNPITNTLNVEAALRLAAEGGF